MASHFLSDPSRAPVRATEMYILCILGLPRSGSTFVGDWLARKCSAVNVGESWQTLRTLGLVAHPSYANRCGKWSSRRHRDTKLGLIKQDPFWSAVADTPSANPFASVLREAAAHSDVIVDCSKTTHALAAYQALGCQIAAVHLIRPFSTWAKSMNRYSTEDGQRQRSKPRLLYAYLRNARQCHQITSRLPSICIQHENLGDLETHVDLSIVPNPNRARRYTRVEMFGTPNFKPQYDTSRAKTESTWFDKQLLRILKLR